MAQYKVPQPSPTGCPRAPRGGNTDRSASSYRLNLKPRSVTESLGELAGPREILSPPAFHGEPPAAWEAFPDVAKRPVPCMGSPLHAGLSCWAVGCPNRALRWRHENPATLPHGMPPRLTGREHGRVSSPYHLNLKPRSATEAWGSLLAHEKSRHHWLFMASHQPPGRPSLMLQNAPFPMGSPPYAELSCWAVGCPKRALRCCNKSPTTLPHGMPPRLTGEEHGRVNTIFPPQTSFRNRGLGKLAGPREIPSPLAFHGEPPAARKAFPDVANAPPHGFPLTLS